MSPNGWATSDRCRQAPATQRGIHRRASCTGSGWLWDSAGGLIPTFGSSFLDCNSDGVTDAPQAPTLCDALSTFCARVVRDLSTTSIINTWVY